MESPEICGLRKFGPGLRPLLLSAREGVLTNLSSGRYLDLKTLLMIVSLHRSPFMDRSLCTLELLSCLMYLLAMYLFKNTVISPQAGTYEYPLLAIGAAPAFHPTTLRKACIGGLPVRRECRKRDFRSTISSSDKLSAITFKDTFLNLFVFLNCFIFAITMISIDSSDAFLSTLTYGCFKKKSVTERRSFGSNCNVLLTNASASLEIDGQGSQELRSIHFQ
ncbi:hypothetical protein IEQ34_005962 [Dendrobium chrysotoxum]|uniref:Uncharacterized protein n=1 Tax=Dendrobium chrysotoxum TaxID=161865 RepID=A0AAV7HDN3_DENCH|nr:hypothetical protein IEQ34_005962 [Dendrobium chrysotoxum]